MTKGAKVLVVIMALVIAVVGISMIEPSFQTIEAPLDITTVSSESLVTGTACEISELTIIDCYANYGPEDSDEVDTMYVIAEYPIDVDTYAAVSLEIDAGTALFDEAYDYSMDESASIGDLVLSCYAECIGTISDEDQLGFYNEAFTAYSEKYLDGGMTLEKTTLAFAYMCDMSENYYDYVSSENTTYLIIGVVFVAIAVLLLVLAFRKPKTPKNPIGNVPVGVAPGATAPQSYNGQAPYAPTQQPYSGQAPYAPTQQPYSGQAPYAPTQQPPSAPPTDET